MQIVSLAVLHGDPPEVFVAADLATLHRVLALEVVARASPGELPDEVVAAVREALLAERWGDAVEGWMRTTDERLDVYESWDVFDAGDVELTQAELQFRPLFGPRP